MSSFCIVRVSLLIHLSSLLQYFILIDIININTYPFKNNIHIKGKCFFAMLNYVIGCKNLHVSCIVCEVSSFTPICRSVGSFASKP